MSRSISCALAGAFILGAAVTANAQTATIEMSDATGQVGDIVDVSITVSATDGISGISLGVEHPPELSLVGTPVLGPALVTPGGIDPAFDLISLSSDMSGNPGFTAAVVVDFLVMTLLPTGTVHQVIDAQYMIGATAVPGTTYPLTFVNDQMVTGGQPVATVVTIVGDEATAANGNLTITNGSVTIPPPIEFIRGDTSQDGALGLTDVILILQLLAPTGMPPMTCFDSYDADGDGQMVMIMDAMFLLQFLYNAGSPPAAPYPACAPAAAYPLGCDMHGACP